MFLLKKILGILLIIQNISAEPPLCISLGSFCATAIHLRFFDNIKTLNIRDNAYPFDWIESSFDSLYTCIDDDFNNFLHGLHLKDNNQILDHYGFKFLHDWPTIQSGDFDILNTDDGVNASYLKTNWRDYSTLVQEKYARRIERFKKACKSFRKVFFIRYHGITEQQAIMLRDLIQKKYILLDFELIVITEDQRHWNLDRIQNFYMYLHDWDKLSLWTNIFDKINLNYKSQVKNT